MASYQLPFLEKVKNRKVKMPYPLSMQLACMLACFLARQEETAQDRTNQLGQHGVIQVEYRQELWVSCMECVKSMLGELREVS